VNPKTLARPARHDRVGLPRKFARAILHQLRVRAIPLFGRLSSSRIADEIELGVRQIRV